MKIILAICILFNISSYSFAQQIIHGCIVDNENKNIDVFNIVLLSVADSAYLKGELFVDGKFEMQVPGDEFLLRISSFEHTDKFIPIKLNSLKTDLGTIVLNERKQTINEVVVMGKTPAVRLREGGGLEFNVSNTMLSNAGTAIDVLKRTPFVMVGADNGVSVIGRNSTLILINGRKIVDQQELMSLSSSEIKNIEVIDNPSAKYEADGHSVINIITSKRVSDFLAGSIFLRGSQGETFNYSVNPEISLKLEKVSFFAGYTFARNTSSGLNYNKHERLTPQGYFSNYSYDLKNNHIGNNHSYRAGIDYQPSKHSSLGIQYNGYSNNTRIYFQRNMDVVRGDNPMYTQYYNKNGNRKPLSNIVSVYYSYQKADYELNFVADYTSRSSNIFDDIEQASDVSLAKYFFKNDSHSAYDLFSAKLDGVIPLKAMKGKIELGAKISYVDNNSSVAFLTKQGEIWLLDPNLSSSTHYKESITGAYAILSGKAGKVNYSAGLRVEVNNVNTRSQKESTDEIRYTKTGLFPNLSVGYTEGNKFNTNLSYSRRIFRPSYSDLNNNISYIDSLSVRMGNPDLKSVYYNTLALNSRIFGKFIVNLSASYVEQPIDMRFINYGPTNESQLTIMENSPNRWMFSVTVGALLKYKIWSTQVYGAFVYSPSMIVDGDVKYNFYNNSFTLAWYNQINLPKGWGIEVNSTFAQPGGSYMNFGIQLSADVSISKSLFKDKLKLQLSSYNQFFNWTQHYQYSNKMYDMTFEDRNKHKIGLTIRYNFTTVRPAFKSKSAGSEERDRM